VGVLVRDINKRRKMELIKIDLQGKAQATITKVVRGYELACFDYVANEWVETYQDLSVALARLAVLSDCVVLGGVFVTNEDDFVYVANEFLGAEVNDYELI
jgi:hypothetical protein